MSTCNKDCLQKKSLAVEIISVWRKQRIMQRRPCLKELNSLYRFIYINMWDINIKDVCLKWMRFLWCKCVISFFSIATNRIASTIFNFDFIRRIKRVFQKISLSNPAARLNKSMLQSIFTLLLRPQLSGVESFWSECTDPEWRLGPLAHISVTTWSADEFSIGRSLLTFSTICWWQRDCWDSALCLLLRALPLAVHSSNYTGGLLTFFFGAFECVHANFPQPVHHLGKICFFSWVDKMVFGV